MRPARIVKIDDIEPGLDLVLVHIFQQRIIGDGGQVIKLVIVDVNRKAKANKVKSEMSWRSWSAAGR